MQTIMRINVVVCLGFGIYGQCASDFFLWQVSYQSHLSILFSNQWLPSFIDRLCGRGKEKKKSPVQRTHHKIQFVRLPPDTVAMLLFADGKSNFFFCSFSIAFRPALYTSQFVSLMSVPLCAFKRLRFWKKKKKENATGFVCPSLNHQVASFAARLDSILKRTVERKLLHKCAQKTNSFDKKGGKLGSNRRRSFPLFFVCFN